MSKELTPEQEDLIGDGAYHEKRLMEETRKNTKEVLDKILEILEPMREWQPIPIQERLDLLYKVLEILRNYKEEK